MGLKDDNHGLGDVRRPEVFQFANEDILSSDKTRRDLILTSYDVGTIKVTNLLVSQPSNHEYDNT